MISLRTMEGLDLDKVAMGWSEKVADQIMRQAAAFERQELVRINGKKVQLTDEGMLRADGIAASLFV